MQQTGLLQLLPQLLKDLLERLKATTGPASSTPQPETGATARPLVCDLPLQFAIREGLRLHSQLSRVWPEAVFVTEVLPDCTAVVLELSWLTLQHLTLLVPSEQQAAPPDAITLSLLGDMLHTAVDAAFAALQPVALSTERIQAAEPQHFHAWHSCWSQGHMAYCWLSSPGCRAC